MSQLQIKASIVLQKTLDAQNTKIICHQGSSRSSKTWSIFQYFLLKALQGEKFVLTIARAKLTWVKATLLMDFKQLCEDYGIAVSPDVNINRQEQSYTINGSEFAFFGLDYAEKLHGRKQTYTWLNEVMEIDRKSFDQLEMRTTKQIVIDYNPAYDDHWVFDLHKRPDVAVIQSTFKDNPFLEQTIVDKLLSYEPTAENIAKGTADNYMWEVYGLGNKARLQGAIFTNWDKAEIPQDAKFHGYGMDFGYSCVADNSRVEIMGGYKQIKDISIGDLVLTRGGYRSVTSTKDMGYRNVYELDFGYDKIILTSDHRIFTSDGWRRVDELSSQEELCIRKSSLTEGLIGDTIMVNTPITFSQPMLERAGYIVIYMNSIMERYQRAIASITEILIRLITKSRICNSLLRQSIRQSITPMGDCRRYLKAKWIEFEQRMGLRKTTGILGEVNLWILLLSVLGSAQSVAGQLLQRIRTSVSVVQNVEKFRIAEAALNNTLARIVQRYLSRRRITQEIPVLARVPVSLRLLKEKRRVFDISVEGEREFFANGLLVHNCDPTTLVGVYTHNNEVYLDEVLYQTGMTNQDITDRFDTMAIPRNQIIVADSSEPKSIEEIRRRGYAIRGAEKGQDSVQFGIDLLKQFKLHLTPRSVNLENEFRKYKWAEDRNGKSLNVPIDEYNHAIDASRYLASYALKAKNKVSIVDRRSFGI
jgi:phage terminase large subunit